MLEYLLIGLYSYSTVKAALVLGNYKKFFNQSVYKIVEVLAYGFILAYIFSYLLKNIGDNSLVISKDLFLICLVLLLITLGIAVGMSFVIHRLEEHLEDSQHSFFADHGNRIRFYSEAWIIINSFIIFFLFSLVEISTLQSAKETSTFLYTLTLVFSFILAILIGLTKLRSNKLIMKVLLGFGTLFTLCILLLFYEGTLNRDIYKLTLVSDFLVFGTVTVLFSLVTLIIQWIKSPKVKEKVKNLEESQKLEEMITENADSLSSFDNLIRTKAVVAHSTDSKSGKVDTEVISLSQFSK